MSQAFVKEMDDNEWLHEIQPVLPALVRYLTKENNGVRVYEKRNYFDSSTGRQVHEMSNGNTYTLDENNQWSVIDN